MKKLLLLITMLGFFTFTITSCGGKEEKAEKDGEYGEYETAEQDKAGDKEEAAATPQDLIKQGQALIDQSDCKTCHHPTNKIIGPAHSEVLRKSLRFI